MNETIGLSHDRSAIVSLIYAFARSKLEYVSMVLSVGPHEVKYKLILEWIQNKFVRYFYKKLYGYYPYVNPSLPSGKIKYARAAP